MKLLCQKGAGIMKLLCQKSAGIMKLLCQKVLFFNNNIIKSPKSLIKQIKKKMEIHKCFVFLKVFWEENHTLSG